MGAPSQVQVSLCVIAAALVLDFVAGSRFAAQAQELQAQALQARATPASCIDPSAYTRSVVSISWYFDHARMEGGRQIIGERATAWFYTSPRMLVTAAHFAEDLPLREWQDVELHQTLHEGEPDVTVRTQLRVAIQGRAPTGQGGGDKPGGDLAEDVAILELRDPFPNAQVLDVRAEKPPKGARVLVLAYPGGKMQAARGIVREAGNAAGRYAGLTLLEVQGSNRLLLNGGTSGAPVIDCAKGSVTGVLNSLLTGPAVPLLPAGHPTVPTPWGSPTNTAVPISALTALRNCIL